MIACVIASGGIGKRFSKNGLPKQFYKINNETILSQTIKNFKNFPFVVSIRKEDEEYFCENYKDTLYTIGGNTRQDSVRNGLSFLSDIFHEIKYVLITDSVRPFVSQNLIQKIIEELQNGEKAVIPVLRITDTLKEVEKGYIMRTFRRDNIVRAQTPQGFDFETIYRLHLKFQNSEFTDDSSLCEKEGIKIKTIEGESRNIKITFPEDIL